MSKSEKTITKEHDKAAPYPKQKPVSKPTTTTSDPKPVALKSSASSSSSGTVKPKPTASAPPSPQLSPEQTLVQLATEHISPVNSSVDPVGFLPLNDIDRGNAFDLIHEQLFKLFKPFHIYHIPFIQPNGSLVSVPTCSTKKNFSFRRCAGFRQTHTDIDKSDLSKPVFMTPLAQIGTGPFDFKFYPVGNLEGQWPSAMLNINLKDGSLAKGEVPNKRFIDFLARKSEYEAKVKEIAIENRMEWFDVFKTISLQSETKEIKDSKSIPEHEKTKLIKSKQMEYDTDWEKILDSKFKTPTNVDYLGEPVLPLTYNMFTFGTRQTLEETLSPTYTSLTGHPLVKNEIVHKNNKIANENNSLDLTKQKTGFKEKLLPVFRFVTEKELQITSTKEPIALLDYNGIMKLVQSGAWIAASFYYELRCGKENVNLTTPILALYYYNSHEKLENLVVESGLVGSYISKMPRITMAFADSSTDNGITYNAPKQLEYKKPEEEEAKEEID